MGGRARCIGYTKRREAHVIRYSYPPLRALASPRIAAASLHRRSGVLIGNVLLPRSFSSRE